MDKAMNRETEATVGWFVDRYAAYVGYQQVHGRKVKTFLAWAKFHDGRPNARLDTEAAIAAYFDDRRVTA